MNWISVKDKLPQKGENGFPTVIVYTKVGEVAVGFLDCRSHEWWVLHDYDACAEFSSDVTHWMPLPEPPKEEEKNG